MKWISVLLIGILSLGVKTGTAVAEESEVIPEVRTQMVKRIHPVTGKSYLSIVTAEKNIPPDPLSGRAARKYSRPDYRMLDYKVSSKTIPYDGPYSDRKKIYFFAGTVATVGTAAGVLGMTTAAASTATASASGGAGAYAAGGAAIATGTISEALIQSKPDPDRVDFTHESESRLVKINNQKAENTSQDQNADAEKV